MAIVKPFRAFRPQADKAQAIACRPYDVLNSEEAAAEAGDNALSFYHVIKPEIDLPGIEDTHTQEVYDKGKSNLLKLIESGVMFQDASPCYYVYAQTMWGKTQFGLVANASVDDYMNNAIRKHELTRPDKEEDRMHHIRVTNFNAEPVFFTYPDNAVIDTIVASYTNRQPEYKFTSADGIIHQVWVIDNQSDVETIEKTFRAEIPYTYVADGHHRTAAAARVGAERRKNNQQHTGNEEYNFFLAVHFPASQLRIIDYNRVIRDLNGLSAATLVTRLSESFEIEKMGTAEYRPENYHIFSMYLAGEWYKLSSKPTILNDSDPIECLDVSILSKAVLGPVFEITDLRKSTRIDFVGGIRGLGELKKRVDSGEMAVAFALYPVTMDQLIRIADTGNIMPPKTTWFEPKLRSGLLLHHLE